MAVKRYDPTRGRYVTPRRQKISWIDDRSGSQMTRRRGGYKPTKIRTPKVKYGSSYKVASGRRVVRTTSSPERKEKTPGLISSLWNLAKARREKAKAENWDTKNEVALVRFEPFEKEELPVDEPGVVFDNGAVRNVQCCPNCWTEFKMEPKCGGICEKCGGRYAVRTKCVLYNASVLTEKQVAANDCFMRIGYTIGTPVKIARGILRKSPVLSERGLFLEMIKYYDELPHNGLDNVAELEGFMYEKVAEYLRKCGEDDKDVLVLAAKKKDEARLLLSKLNGQGDQT